MLQDKIIETILSIQRDKIVILIDGRGGSGKSTIAKELASRLQDSVTYNLDEYTVDPTDLFDPEIVAKNFDIDFENTEYDQVKIVKEIDHSKNKYHIIEGCFSFRNIYQIKPDLKIWVELDKELSAERLNLREKQDPSRSKIPPEVIELSTSKWQEREDIYIVGANPKDAADFIVLN